MAVKVASLRDGAMASTAAVSDALGMVRGAGTSARAGGWAGSSCPAGGAGASMWSSTASGTPLSSSRGKWSRTAGALIAPSLAKVTTCVEPPAATTSSGRHSLWASVSTPGHRTCRLSSGRPKGQRRRAGQRARERGGGDDESKRKHDRQGSRKHSFERAGLRQEALKIRAVGRGWCSPGSSARPMLAASAFSRTPCRAHGTRRTRARRGHGHCR